MNNRELKNKILDKTNEICYECFSTSLYNICGLDVNDAGYIKEILLGDTLAEIKTMGVGTFISSIPMLSRLLADNPIFGNKDRAFRQLYDNRIIIDLMEKAELLIENKKNIDVSSMVEDVSAELAEYAIYLAGY